MFALFLLLTSLIAKAATVGAAFTTTTNALSGSGTLSVKVPGNFVTVNPADPTFSGRRLIKIGIFFGAPASGDRITAINVKDSDGVVPAQYKALFPNYPILKSLLDQGAPSDNQVIYLPTTMPIQIEPSPGNGQVPSAVYIVFSVQKNSAVSDTLFVNFLWDDGI